MVYFMIPVLASFFISVVINIFYSRQLERNVSSHYSKNLNLISTALTQWLNQVLSTTNLLILDDDTNNFIFNDVFPMKENVSQTYSIIKMLTMHGATSEFISGIAIVKRNSEDVISTYGTSNMRNYFTQNHVYDKYPLEFWDSLSLPSIGYDILGLSRVSSQKDVIPLVASGYFGIKSSNIIIIDIDCQAISNVFLKAELSEYGEIYIYDKITHATEIGRASCRERV